MWTGIGNTFRGGVTGYTPATNPINTTATGYVPMAAPVQTQQAPSQPIYGMPDFSYTPSAWLQQQIARSNQQFNNPITAPRGWNNAPMLSILPKLSYESQGQQAPALSNGGLLGK